MTRNSPGSGGAGTVGRLDRGVRLVLAVVLIGFALVCPFARQLGTAVVWGSGALGAVLMVTVVLGRCPLYGLIGIRT